MEAGLYFGKLIDSGLNVSQGGTECFELVFEVSHFANNGDWEPLPQLVKRTIRLWLSEKAWPYSQQKLDALGFSGDFSNPRFGEQAQGVQLNCKIEQYQQKPVERWDLYYEGAGERKAPPQDAVRKLNAKWQQAQANTRKPAGLPPAPPRPAPTEDAPIEEPTEEISGGAPFGNDDIPF